MHRKKVTTYALLSLVMCLVISITTAFSLLWQPLETVHAYSSDQAVSVNEIYKGEDEPFVGENLNAIFSLLIGGAGDYNAVKSAVDSGSLASNSVANKNIIIEFGGMKWLAVYISKADDSHKNEIDTAPTGEGKGIANNGDIVLTLWLAYAPNDDEHKGLWNNGRYPDNGSYPLNLYGTSYMRSQVLNNGGDYWKSLESLESGSQSKDNIFAAFTMGENGKQDITDYLVAPRYIAWQYNQSAKAQNFGISYDLNNDAWGTETKSNFYDDGSGNYYYHDKDKYTAWKDDLLWLPSLAETGAGVGSNLGISGMWKTTAAQRSSTPRALTRSAVTGEYHTAFDLDKDGKTNYMWVNEEQVVRPALHLNLTKASQAASYQKPTGDQLAKTVQYNGTAQEWELPSIIGATYNAVGDSTDWWNAADHKITATNAGVYKVTVNPPSSGWRDGTRDAVTFTMTINSIDYSGTASVEANGDLVYDGNGKTASLTNTYSGADGTTPTGTIYYEGVLPTQYTKSATAPKNAGTYKTWAEFTTTSKNYNAPAETGKVDFTITPADIKDDIDQAGKFALNHSYIYHSDFQKNPIKLKLPESGEAEFPLSLKGSDSWNDVKIYYYVATHKAGEHSAWGNIETKLADVKAGTPIDGDKPITWKEYTAGDPELNVSAALGYCVFYKVEAGSNYNTLYGYFSVHIYDEELDITLVEGAEDSGLVFESKEYGEVAHSEDELRSRILAQIATIKSKPTEQDGDPVAGEDRTTEFKDGDNAQYFDFYFKPVGKSEKIYVGENVRLHAGTYEIWVEYIKDKDVGDDDKHITFKWYNSKGEEYRPKFTVLPRKINVELTVNGGGTYKQTPADKIVIGTPTRSGAGNWYGEASAPQNGLLEFLKITYTYTKKNGGYSGELSADMPAGDYSITAASANGDYDVTFTFAEGKDTYTVAKATPSVTPQFTHPEHLYTSGSLPALSYASADGVEGTIAWDQYTLEAGRKSYGWTFTPDDEDNYNKVTGTSEFSVESVELKSISAQFEQGENVIYTTDTLDSLKQYLTVKGTNNDGSDYGAITEYSLTGSLNAGSSSIIVSYGGFTTTFTVTVTTPTTPEPDNPPTTDPEPDDPSGGTGDSGNEGSGDNGSANNNGSLDGGDVGPLVVVVGVEAVMLVALIAAVAVLRKR